MTKRVYTFWALADLTNRPFIKDYDTGMAALKKIPNLFECYFGKTKKDIKRIAFASNMNIVKVKLIVESVDLKDNQAKP